MKKLLFLSVILASSFHANSQEINVETMSKDELATMAQTYYDLSIELNSVIDSISYAHEKHAFCEAINNDTTWQVQSPWDFLDIKVVSCKGDRETQTVAVELLITNSNVNQHVYLQSNESVAIDNTGRTGRIKSFSDISINSGRQNGTIYTDVPVRVKLSFSQFIPGTEKFNLIAFQMSSGDTKGESYAAQRRTVEIKNVAIEW